jgi:hypothetical protein
MFWAIFLFGFMFMLLNEFEDECIAKETFLKGIIKG